MEPIFELPRPGSVPHDAMLRVCATNHQSTAHRARHESSGRQFIDGQHNHLDCACEDHSFLDERQISKSSIISCEAKLYPPFFSLASIEVSTQVHSRGLGHDGDENQTRNDGEDR
ncbi:unnamed protein product [Heterotrigona itama]|uniref:Uncharacterized protein n=1 Tax=Heterotrigona itama TaxID=395501 RepID=A0A6V7GXC5_9HYME|nr:unnamed protein product [Heterotrigona itama]